MGISDQTLRNWIKAFDAGKLGGAGARAVTPEQMELSKVRAENIKLRRELEIVKKSGGVFREGCLWKKL